MIEIKNLTFFYEAGKPIFEDFSFSISKGESLSVLGPSGCGKSTFLYLLSGLLRPQKGEILIDGERLVRPRERTGLILQDYGLLPWKTIKENVELGLKLRGIFKDSLTESWMRRLGIFNVKDRYPHQVSGGEKQRAAIGRSLVLKPDLILMDEPFSSLDAPTRETLEDLIFRLKEEENLTVVLVTHMVDEAAYLGDRILLFMDPPQRKPQLIEKKRRFCSRLESDFLNFQNELKRRIETLWNQGQKA